MSPRSVADAPGRVGGVGGVMLLARRAIRALRGGEQHQIDAEHRDLRTASLRGNPEIQPGMTPVAWMCLSKKRLPPIRAGRREDVHQTMIEQGPNLVLCPADGGCRCHNFWSDRAAIDLVAAQRIERRLVEAHHCPQRARDQM